MAELTTTQSRPSPPNTVAASGYPSRAGMTSSASGTRPSSTEPAPAAARGLCDNSPRVSLTGDLATMELLDLLGWLALRRKTGTLHVRSRAVHKQLVLREGALQACHSNDPRETLGQFLVRDRLITEEDLFKALLRQEQERRRLGAILVARRPADADQVKRALRENGTEARLRPVPLDRGTLRLPGPGAAARAGGRPRLDLASVVKEGDRRMREWERMRERFPSLHVVFRVEARPRRAEATRRSADLVRPGGRGPHPRQIAMHTRRSRFETALFLHDLATAACWRSTTWRTTPP